VYIQKNMVWEKNRGTFWHLTQGPSQRPEVGYKAMSNFICILAYIITYL